VRFVVAPAFGPRQVAVLGVKNDRGWTRRAGRCGSARTRGDALRSQFHQAPAVCSSGARSPDGDGGPPGTMRPGGLRLPRSRPSPGMARRSASGSSGRDRRGQRPGMTSREPAEIGRPRGEVREPRRANEILKAASAFFAAGLDRPRPTSWGSSTSTKMCSGSIGSGLSALRRGEDVAGCLV
jgi:hypothetical protein